MNFRYFGQPPPAPLVPVKKSWNRLFHAEGVRLCGAGGGGLLSCRGGADPSLGDEGSRARMEIDIWFGVS